MLTAPPYRGNETTLGMGTKGPLNQGLLAGCNGYNATLTPVNVIELERALFHHPDRLFVSSLLNSLKYGADIGYTGHRVPRFSRNLTTALEQPNVVTENLIKEVAWGRMAGPFPTPPLPNFQVSFIGLVPKKHSDKFRTIFSLSFPKSGTTSINFSIPKEDYSLQYITIGVLSLGQGCYLAKTDV